MKQWLVGGAVRDRLMGVTSKDEDFVVVGAMPEQMLAEGFEQVGAAFPVSYIQSRAMSTLLLVLKPKLVKVTKGSLANSVRRSLWKKTSLDVT